MKDFFTGLFSSGSVTSASASRSLELTVFAGALDAVIGISYLFIALSLLVVIYRRRDFDFPALYILFGGCLLTSGLSRALGVWAGDAQGALYTLEQIVKAFCAAFSAATAILVIRMVPGVLSLPSAREMRAEILERENAEREVRRLNRELENRVLERTGALKLANSLLAESERRRSLALDAAKMGTWFWDTEFEHAWICDERCRMLIGLTDDEPVTYAQFLQAVDPEDRPMVHRSIQAALESGSGFDTEYRVEWSDGSKHWLRTNGTAELQPAGHPRTMQGITMDVSERKRLYEALTSSEQRFRTLAEAVPDMLFTAAEDGTLTYLSARFQEYTAMEPSGVDQSGFWKALLHPGDYYRQVSLWKQSLRTGQPFENECRIRRHDGAFRWFVSRAMPMRPSPESSLHWLGACTDIDRLKRTETALRYSNDELRQFAYAAAHDLQEPLRNIVNSGELLWQLYGDALDEEAGELIKVCVEGGARMHGMVKDLLAYSKVVDGIEPSADAVDSGQVLAQALANLGTAISESKARVLYESLPAVPAERTHLLQLFQNLIGNALKYRKPDTPPLIRISARLQEDQWVFAVSDNGIGFNPAYAQKIFGVFKRLHNRQEYPGNGIGLAICARIVAHYGGRIWAEGRSGVGATFLFTVPAQEDVSCNKQSA